MQLKRTNKPWEEETDQPTRRKSWWPVVVVLALAIAGFAYYRHITRVPGTDFRFLKGHKPVKAIINEESPFLFVLYHLKRPAKELQEEAKRELPPPDWEYPERKLGDILGRATRPREDGVIGYFINKGRAPAGTESPAFDSDGDPEWSHVMIAYVDPMPVWIREFLYQLN